MSPRSNLLFLCLIGLSFVLDQFGFYNAGSLCIATAWAAAIPAIAGAVGSIGSGIMNLVSQADANEANKQIAAENREWQSGENQLSRDWQEKMWNAQNAYNTPSAMKARLKEAGWNPFLADSEVGSASNAGSAGSPSMQSPPTQPDVFPLDFGFVGQAAQNAANAYYQAEAVDANVANQSANADKTNIDNADALQQIYGKAAAQSYLSSKIKQTQGLNMDSSQKAAQNLARTESAQAQARLDQVNADIAQEFGSKKADVEIRERERTIDRISQDIMESSVRMSKSASDIQLNEQKIKESLSSYYRNLAEAGMFRKLGNKYVAETSTINSLRDGLVQQLTISNNRVDLMYQTESTIFEADEGVRGYLTSRDAKENRAKSAKLDNDRYVHAVERSTQTIRNFLPDFLVPITGSGVTTSTGSSSGSVSVSGFSSRSK